jgi:hypothetical protein
VEWSRERIEQLAPDAATAKAGLGLAKPAQWRTLGRSDQVIWGECQGNGANPYQVRVALADAGYRCICPSRKQPRNRTLALLYLYVGGVPTVRRRHSSRSGWPIAPNVRMPRRLGKLSSLELRAVLAIHAIVRAGGKPRPLDVDCAAIGLAG